MKETVIDIKKSKVGEVELDDAIFGAKLNKALRYEVVKMQLAGKRKGTDIAENPEAIRHRRGKSTRKTPPGHPLLAD